MPCFLDTLDALLELYTGTGKRSPLIPHPRSRLPLLTLLPRRIPNRPLTPNLILHLTPPLHLRMKLDATPNPLPINILPINLGIPPLQNLPVHLRAPLPQHRGPPLSVLHNGQFHAATHGLRDAELAAQKAHFQVVLLLLPGCEARFEGVGGGCVRCAAGFGRGRGEVQVVAERVVDARGGGGAEVAGCGGGGGSGGDDAEGLGGVSWGLLGWVDEGCVPWWVVWVACE